MLFVVAGEAAVCGDPRQCPLDRPALRLDLEALLARVLADDRQLAAEDLCRLVDQASGEALVRPDLLHTRMVEAGPQQRTLRTVTVLNARGDDVDGQEQAEGVGDDEPLAALDFLTRVEAPGRGGNGVGRAHGLRVDQPGARLGITAVALADPVTQGIVDGRRVMCIGCAS